jgi:hypothetical protein
MKKWILLFCLMAGFSMLAQAQDAPKDTTLKEYTGKYLFPTGTVIAETSISIGSDGLLTSSSSAGVSELVKVEKEKDVFELPKFQGKVKFNRDEKGKVVGISINAMGYQLEGTKAPDGITLRLYKNFVTNDPFVAFSIR